MNEFMYRSIRYAKFHFELILMQDCALPIHKTSALRGGIGEMLLRAHCIRNRECDSCDFQRDCIVQRTMYSFFENKPAYVTTGESVGYVLECEDYGEEYQRGDSLNFNLILFWRNHLLFYAVSECHSRYGDERDR